MRIGARVTSSSKRYGSYPSLKNEDIDGCIAYAAELTRERVVPLVHRENAPIYSQEISSSGEDCPEFIRPWRCFACPAFLGEISMSLTELKVTSDALLTKRVLAFSLVYLAIYAIVSWADLFTTKLALQQPFAVETNVFVVSEQGYSGSKALTLSVVGAVFLLPFLVFGLVAAQRVSERWLQQPIRSFGKWYLNPFSKQVIDRSPLHMLSIALAFPPIKLLAAGNNWLIAQTGDGPIGWIIVRVSKATSPALGFGLVLGSISILLIFACSPLAALILRRFGAGSKCPPPPAIVQD